MIILGLGTRPIVAWSREPRKGTFAPTLRTTQQGSWLQWYQLRPMAKSVLSQMTCATISKPMYVDWLIAQPTPAAPLERVPEQARAAVVEALRGQPREAVREASRGAIRDA